MFENWELFFFIHLCMKWQVIYWVSLTICPVWSHSCIYTFSIEESILCIIYLFIWVLTSLSTHCTGHITTGSFYGAEETSTYSWVSRFLYCKLPTNGKQLPAFPLEVGPGTEPRSQRWEARVLPLCHRGPLQWVYIHARCTWVYLTARANSFK